MVKRTLLNLVLFGKVRLTRVDDMAKIVILLAEHVTVEEIHEIGIEITQLMKLKYPLKFKKIDLEF